MATLEDYEAVAPDVMAVGSFTVNQIENKLDSVPELPADPVEPEVTQAMVVAIFNTVFSKPTVAQGVAAAGGFGQIALSTGLWPKQVKELIRQMAAMLDLYRSEQ